LPRPHIESIHAYDVAAHAVEDGPFAGSSGRLLSEDDGDGSWTALHRFPAGWSADLSGPRPTELFVLAGEGELGGESLRPGWWAWVPTGAAGAQLSFTAESEVLVMVEPERPGATGEIVVVDSHAVRYENSKVGSPAGLVVKELRTDPEVGDRSWVAGAAAGWLGFKAEIHPTVEEAFLIRGDCLLGNSGAMRAGDYFWRPSGVYHGPFATREGMLFFFRTKGGDMAVEFFDVPDWDERAHGYYEAGRYFPVSE
jgi:hypothetical protein